MKSQIRRDNGRECYKLAFPADLTPEQVVSWLRSVVGNLARRSATGFGHETFVFEVWASSTGFTHRLLIPKEAAEFITQELRTHGRGMTVTLDDSRPNHTWSAGIELGMSNGARTLDPKDHEAISNGVLSAMQGLQANEAVLMQWVIAPALNTSVNKKAVSTDFSMLKALSGYSLVASDEMKDRQKKLEQPNVLAVGRVLARAQAERALELTERVESALKALDSSHTHIKRVVARRAAVTARTTDAQTPSRFPAQFNLTELAAVIGWPFGNPLVAGLHIGTSRQLPATEAVPRTGRFIGTSNFPGSARPIAVGREESLRHLHVMGPTGVGKTTLLSNLIAQDMRDGYGVIMMEAKGDLFRDAKQLIPSNRVKDVVLLDVNERLMPVGFNVLEQGNPAVVIDQLTELFQNLYPDTRGVWMRELMYMGLKSLAERGGMTFVELGVLVMPRTTEEIAWANEVRRSVKDPELRDFWARWEALSNSDREKNSSPLHNRIWQLTSRPELRNVIGQSKSSFYMDDIIRENKILLINLSGVPSEAASIAGTLIMNAVWNSVQRVRASRANYLYLDEFQDFIRLPVGAEDMLAKARGFGLGITLAHQHLGQLSSDVMSAVMTNARSKVMFRIEAHDDARAMARAFGSDVFSEQDFQNINAYEAVAKISTSSGSSVVTMRTLPPRPSTGTEQSAVELSRQMYGRPIEQVKEEIQSRRVSEKKTSHKPLPIGIEEWG